MSKASKSYSDSKKIRKTGNSLGCIFPKSIIEEFHLQSGDTITFKKQENGILITTFDPEFEKQMEAAERMMKKYQNVLRKLASS